MFEKINSLVQANKNDVLLMWPLAQGSLAVEFAKRCKQVTGIDITPAMIEQAKILQENESVRQHKVG